MKKLISNTALLFLMVLFVSSCSSTKMANTNNPQYVISVTQAGKPLGEIVIELYKAEAPLHVANFESLVAEGVYNGTAFHRVIPGFMIQGGDPNSKNGPKDTWGFGDPSLKKVPAEFSDTLSHKRGILSAARSQDPNSASSQFFICTSDATFLDRQYSIFGQVLSGMEVADKVVNTPRDGRDNPLEKVTMEIRKVSK